MSGRVTLGHSGSGDRTAGSIIIPNVADNTVSVAWVPVAGVRPLAECYTKHYSCYTAEAASRWKCPGCDRDNSTRMISGEANLSSPGISMKTAVTMA